MRSVESIVAELPPSSSVVGADGGGGGGSWLYGWLVECHGLWHNVLMIVPSALFVLYLASQAKRSFSKVSNSRSHVVAALYAILWLVSIFNLAWCSLQVWECAPGKQFMWSVISLFTTSGMLFLEVSLIAFLLQGNHASGREALTQTFLISTLVVGLDICLKDASSVGKQISCRGKGRGDSEGGVSSVEDIGILHGKGRGNSGEMGARLFTDLLGTARPAFQNYISIMFCVNATALLACALAAHGTGLGLWLYNITVICYHAMYLPLLYVTFLADFFQEDDLHLENVYYSEMKDAGFFDVDWD
ncbi:putative LOB domain-containing protein 20-like [Capsicum annuum]|nr:putative LOB domain-containing protein 20-like [Capsicum annuum]